MKIYSTLGYYKKMRYLSENKEEINNHLTINQLDIMPKLYLFTKIFNSLVINGLNLLYRKVINSYKSTPH